MKHKKYYFVFYKSTLHGRYPPESGGHPTESVTLECQQVIDIHPLQFQLDCTEKYGKWFVSAGNIARRSEYMVISWQELSKEEYDTYKGRIG